MKRIYIYALALSVVIIASNRGATEDSPNLGTRLIELTKDIFPYYNNYDFDDNKDRDDTRFQQLEVLNDVDDSTQAIGLPILVVCSLIASLFFVLVQQTSDIAPPSASFNIDWSVIQSFIQPLTTISNAIVISLFARSELQRLFVVGSENARNDDIDDDDKSNNNSNNLGITASIIALGLSTLAFIGPSNYVWPIQNILCACLAITVSRAIQIPRLIPIVIALSALMVYDVLSVGIQLINLGAASIVSQQDVEVAQQVVAAATVTVTETAKAATASSSTAAASTNTAAAAAANSSVMGAVAMAKVQASGNNYWQPGLFQVRLRGIVTDLLGLGDAVFPTLLTTFCLRYDNFINNNQQRKQLEVSEKESNDENNNNDNKNKLSIYFITSLIGYSIGCFACELVPGISDTGLPALLFLVPSMLILVIGLAIIRGELSDLIEFDPAAGQQQEEE